MASEEAVPARVGVTGDDPEQQLNAALANAQAEFPAITKGQTAEVESKRTGAKFTYMYADLADVLAAVRPVLSANGLSVIQPTVIRDGKLILLTQLRHVMGATLMSEVELKQDPGAPQDFGGALTYLRRYELCTLLGIAAEEDTDGQGVTAPAARAAAPELPAWARPASQDRQAAFVAALESQIGAARANALGAAIAKQLGAFPDAVVGVTRAVVHELSKGSGESPAPAPEEDPKPEAEATPAAEPSTAPAEPEEPQDGPPLPGAEEARADVAL